MTNFDDSCLQLNAEECGVPGNCLGSVPGNQVPGSSALAVPVVRCSGQPYWLRVKHVLSITLQSVSILFTGLSVHYILATRIV